MGRKCFLRSAVFLLLLLIACDSPEDLRSIAEISIERECQANMNVLATDQAMHHTNYGRWAVSMEELNVMVGRLWMLTCPETGEEYILEPLDDGYSIMCPYGHGSVNTGRRSWTGNNP